MKASSEYGTRLKALKQEQQRLERKQAQLLDKRRAELGRLAEKVGLLEIDDDAIAGALLELKAAMDSPANDGRLQQWRAAPAMAGGRSLLSRQRQRPQNYCAAHERRYGGIYFRCNESLMLSAASIPGAKFSSAA
jgi:Conjugal transfer protein TraD